MPFESPSVNVTVAVLSLLILLAGGLALGLTGIPGGYLSGAILVVAPAKLEGGSGGPVRLLALVR